MTTADRYPVPLWIRLYALFLIVTGLTGAYAGYFDPTVFFANFQADYDSFPHTFLNGLWGTRNLSAVVVLVVGLLLKDARILFAAYLYRFLTEVQDIFILSPLTIPPELTDSPLMLLGMVVVIVIPEGLGAWALFRIIQKGRKAEGV